MGRVEFLPYAESVELIKNRQLDATLQSSAWAWPPSATWPAPCR